MSLMPPPDLPSFETGLSGQRAGSAREDDRFPSFSMPPLAASFLQGSRLSDAEWQGDISISSSVSSDIFLSSDLALDFPNYTPPNLFDAFSGMFEPNSFELETTLPACFEVGSLQDPMQDFFAIPPAL